MSKYFSMEFSIFLPNILKDKATRKNLPARPIADAMIRIGRAILNNPAVMVIALYGMGVKAAVKIVRNAFASYFCRTISMTDSRWYVDTIHLPTVS